MKSQTALASIGTFFSGYTFGATIVPFNDADREEYGWKKEVRSLRLIQFSQRSQVCLPHNFLGQRLHIFWNCDVQIACFVFLALLTLPTFLSI